MVDIAIPVHIPLVATPRAHLGELHALAWRVPNAAREDLPNCVRAGSAVRRWRDSWCIVQDDVRALAVLDSLEPLTARMSAPASRDPVGATPLLLPADEHGARSFDSTRGNKAAKLDLEASVVLPDGRMLVFGSGAAEPRERVVVIGPGAVRIVAARALYARLHEQIAPTAVTAPTTTTTNIEGAIVIADRLRLFQRAVGIANDTNAPRAPNLTLDFDLAAFQAWLDHRAAPPQVVRVIAYDLGLAESAVIGFTDAALLPNGAVGFLACAEATGDPILDGRVVATRFGVLDDAAGWQSEIVDGAGDRVLDKLEGLEPAGAPGSFVVVSDADDPALPARIAALRVDPAA